MKKRISIVLCLFVAMCVFLAEYNFLFVYHVELNGENNTIIDVNSNYKDDGINVIYRGLPYSKYKTYNNVNTHKLGIYTIKYLVGKKVLFRNVIVKDISAPVINLEGNETYDLQVGQEYKEPGYTAIDNYDGNVTKEIKISGDIVDYNKVGKYKIDYMVTDKSGNIGAKTRIVNVADHEKPVITLSSKLKDYSIINKKVDIYGYKAYDSYDGDITSKVILEDNLNIKKAGIYEVKYTVKDSSDNETTVIKKINIQKKNTKGIPVLMYHWFYDDTKGEKPGDKNTHNYISKTNLTAQLKYLKDNNYYFPTWDELDKYIDGKLDLPEKSVIITDDDCVGNFLNIALPLFQEYEIPVTSFCITSKKYWKNFVDSDYITFESHTDSLHKRSCSSKSNAKHWDGAVMCSDYKTIYNDIKTSVDLVKNTDAFAYPFGHYTDDTIKALKENGIGLAFTINNGRVKKGSNKYKLPRVRISRTTTLKEFASKIK